MRKIFVIIILLPLISLCTSPKEQYNLNDSGAKFVDITVSYPVEEPISIYELVNIQGFVQLKDSERFFITSANKIEEWNNKYLIFDGNKEVVAAFGGAGDYVSTVGNKGEGPGYYHGVTDFVVDRSRELILIYSRGNQSLFEYDKNLEFVRQIKLGIFAFHMSLLESGNIAFYLDMDADRDGNGNIWIYDIDGNILEKHMDYPGGNEYISFSYTGFLKNGFYTYPLSSKIFRLKENGQPDELVWDISIPRGLEESEIFGHQKYLSCTHSNFASCKNILNQFELGEQEAEILFKYDYSYKNGKAIGLGVVNKSGQVFSHMNLKMNWFHSSFFNLQSVPTYSISNNMYYSASNLDYVEQYSTAFEELDTPLAKAIQHADPEGNPIIIKFKLKEKYEPG